MEVYDYYITPDEYAQSEKIGVHRELLNRRIRGNGWDKERAITTPPRKVSKYDDCLHLAEENGISKRRFFKRIYQGWTPIEAATKPIGGGKRRYSPEDVAAAAENGISYDTFKFRVSRSKWSVEKAKSTPVLSLSECGKRAAKVCRERHGNLFAPIFLKIK
ncbi:hypothetical protein ACI2LM_15575 [Paenibacillus lautus]|uniref:hypothetical protein n=1 Tax=Paenibacillus lautus TaxID=1401 RepID=UPI00384E524E